MKPMLKYAVLGALIFGSVGPFATYVPRYYIAGYDVTWMVFTAELTGIGAAVGIILGWLLDRWANRAN